LFAGSDWRADRRFHRFFCVCNMADCNKNFHYGGQAVIEGVMMRGPKDFAVAVRRSDGEIVLTTESVEGVMGRFKWLNKPFLRGTLALIDSLALGIKALKFSADIAMKDAAEEDARKKSESSGQQPEPDKAVGKVNDAVVGVTMVLGLALGFGIFFFVPILLTRWAFGPADVQLEGSMRFARALFEGGLKIVLFVGYVSLISLMPDIRRVFQYHGAEHKTINAYESGVPLTVDDVSKATKVHVRCGTSFVLVVLLISILVFMFLPWNSLLARFGYKILLMPLVAGIAYEIIKFAGKRKESALTRFLLLPGLLMQKITTREPEPYMMEVAIKSLQSVMDKQEVECAAEESHDCQQ